VMERLRNAMMPMPSPIAATEPATAIASRATRCARRPRPATIDALHVFASVVEPRIGIRVGIQNSAGADRTQEFAAAGSAAECDSGLGIRTRGWPCRT
jgi:hypothetical protein